MPLDAAPPRGTRFGSPLVLSRVHWVRPELVAEVKFLAWTEDNLLRQVVYEGLREDKPAREVRREIPHQNPATSSARSPTMFASEIAAAAANACSHSSRA
jgi:bifunctional non-homologous end joining protein LigD